MKGQRGEVRILIDSLRKKYGAVQALDGLSLRVRAGEIHGLIGPDGAGKTTVMRIACALVRPDEGTCRVMGYDCRTEGHRVKEHLGYMPQRFSLYPDLTLGENLRFFADLFGVPANQRRARQEELMAFSGLGPFLQRRAGALSGGMKQKLALCCTLIHTPDVLVLDEPTTGVDVQSRSEFWKILRNLAGEGMALLVSTPYMDEAMRFDGVSLMHRGRVMASGTPDEVRRRFTRRLLEISGRDLLPARGRVLALAEAGLEVHRFGDRLHVVHDRPAQEERIRAELKALEIEVTRAEPTMEDAFIALVTSKVSASA